LDGLVNDRTPVPRPSEAGFLLVEVLVAVAIVAVCAGAALAAAGAVVRTSAHAVSAAALTRSAENIVTDLRAATAYDPAELAALAGKSRAFDAPEPGPDGSPRPVHITVNIRRLTATDSYAAVVTARTEGASAVTVAATLVQEAPAPGTILSASTPPPASASSAAGLDEPDAIQL
jgi:type II secretory pathway pseudopilin PulG